jgi:hypothetical protein
LNTVDNLWIFLCFRSLLPTTSLHPASLWTLKRGPHLWAHHQAQSWVYSRWSINIDWLPIRFRIEHCLKVRSGFWIFLRLWNITKTLHIYASSTYKSILQTAENQTLSILINTAWNFSTGKAWRKTQIHWHFVSINSG